VYGYLLLFYLKTVVARSKGLNAWSPYLIITENVAMYFSNYINMAMPISASEPDGKAIS